MDASLSLLDISVQNIRQTPFIILELLKRNLETACSVGQFSMLLVFV